MVRIHFAPAGSQGRTRQSAPLKNPSPQVSRSGRSISQEGDTTIIPVVEEIVVVERRLVLKEEVRIRRVSTTEQHQETVVLREQEAVITREEADSQPQ